MILLMKYPKMGLIMSVDSSLARIGFGDIYADLDQLRDSASFGVANQNHKNCEKNVKRLIIRQNSTKILFKTSKE